MTSRASIPQDVANILRGLLMGGADIIPGVSGGTVALILGIYERLVTAISHFDLVFLGQLKRHAWGDAARHVDLRFIITLAAGIAVGIASLASLMHTLLEDHRSATFGLFFGLILASSFLVARMVGKWGPIGGLAAVVGAAVAFWLTGPASGTTILPFGPDEVGRHVYVFVCGMIAICAMILPGISGAYLLVLLGEYAHVTGIIKRTVQLEVELSELLVLVVFAAGCVVGLLGFSKLLRWLLARFHATTLALLCGFMLGSLRKLWPYKTSGDVNGLPANVGEAWLPAALALGGVLFVLALGHLARRPESA